MFGTAGEPESLLARTSGRGDAIPKDASPEEIVAIVLLAEMIRIGSNGALHALSCSRSYFRNQYI